MLLFVNEIIFTKQLFAILFVICNIFFVYSKINEIFFFLVFFRLFDLNLTASVDKVVYLLGSIPCANSANSNVPSDRWNVRFPVRELYTSF